MVGREKKKKKKGCWVRVGFTFGIFDSSDEIDFCEVGDAFVHGAAASEGR